MDDGEQITKNGVMIWCAAITYKCMYDKKSNTETITYAKFYL